MIAGTQVLTRTFEEKEENVRNESNHLRECLEMEMEKGVRRERDVMEYLKSIVSETKGEVES